MDPVEKEIEIHNEDFLSFFMCYKKYLLRKEGETTIIIFAHNRLHYARLREVEKTRTRRIGKVRARSTTRKRSIIRYIDFPENKHSKIKILNYITKHIVYRYSLICHSCSLDIFILLLLTSYELIRNNRNLCDIYGKLAINGNKSFHNKS